MSEPVKFDPFRQIFTGPADLICGPAPASPYLRREAIRRAIFPVETCALQQKALAELEQEVQTLRQTIWESTLSRQRPMQGKRGRLRAEVYFVRRGDNLVKIGFSKNVDRRLRELEAEVPDRLELLATIPADADTERDLHNRFAHCRVRRDREWFNYTPELQAYVEGIGRRR